MIMPGREAAIELAGRTLCDIAHVLESAEGAEGRVRGVLELLGKVVPYQCCALLEAEPGCDPRVIAVPGMPLDEERELTGALVNLFGKLLADHALAAAPSPPPWASHLAVPLIGLDEVIGVLFVSRVDGAYDVANLRVLSLVAAQLGAYLMLLRVRMEEAARLRKVEEAKRAASAALRARATALTLVAEELRGPFEAAKAWLRVLGSRNLSPAARARAIEAVERSVRTQNRLVSDLSDVSSAAGLQLELRPVQPARLIEVAIDDLRPLAEQRSIRIESALDRSVGPMFGDAGRLDEVFAILLANAFSSTPDGGCVQVRLEPDGDGARIQVIDSGKGFSAERLSHLFECLDSPEGSLPTDEEGFEIGLLVAKHVVELHGGSIRAESPGEGKGATFTVGLPQLRQGGVAAGPPGKA
jgi:signal transduction histidine kinase